MIEKSIGPFRLSMSFAANFFAAQVHNREARIFDSFKIHIPRGLEKGKNWLKLTLSIAGFNPVSVSLTRLQFGDPDGIARCEAKALENTLLPEGLAPARHYDAMLTVSHMDGVAEVPFSFEIMDASIIPLDFSLAHLLSFHISEHSALHAFVSTALSAVGAPAAEETLAFLYNALTEKGLNYLPPPTPVVSDAQYLRSAPQVLQNGGTCADLSLLMASLLHCAGKYPALLLFANHMAAGVFTGAEAPAFHTLANAKAVYALVTSGELMLVETTDMTTGRKASFEKAQQDILSHLQLGAPCVLVNTTGVLRSASKLPLSPAAPQPLPAAQPDPSQEISPVCPYCGYEPCVATPDGRCPVCMEKLPQPVKVPHSAPEATPAPAAVQTVPVITSSCPSVLYTAQPGHVLVNGLKKDETEVRLDEKRNGLPVAGIYDRAFENRSVRRIHMPHTIQVIGSYAFSGCPLPSVTLPPYLKEIKNGAFYNSGLKEVVIPHMVKAIHTLTFANCRQLRSVTLPEGLESIESGAFARCPLLTSVTIPASVKHIAPDAFDEGCELLKLSYTTLNTP